MRTGGSPDRGVPEISVVVPSHDRPIRLRWLLNALEEQTLPRSRWELVVVHDSGDDTEELLRSHPLAQAGVLRHLRLERNSGLPGRQRNAGWREARAPLVAFTDDDCRPERDWLERLLAAAGDHEGAIVQGTTRPDPDEALLLEVSHRARSLEVDPPGTHAQTCNILYPRAALERVGGFDESVALRSGEDTDLALRARATGAGYAAAPDALVYHAVEVFPLHSMLRWSWRWRDLARVVARHPHMRSHLYAGVFWRRSHALLPLAVMGALLGARRPWLAALAAPYLRELMRTRRAGRRRALAEIPGRAAVDAVEMAALAAGSVRHRTLML